MKLYFQVFDVEKTIRSAYLYSTIFNKSKTDVFYLRGTYETHTSLSVYTIEKVIKNYLKLDVLESSLSYSDNLYDNTYCAKFIVTDESMFFFRLKDETDFILDSESFGTI